MIKLKYLLEVVVKCDNSSWMRSLESSYIRITSPTGKSITIKKMLINSDKLSDKEKSLVYRCVGNGMIRDTNKSVDVTKDEMKTLLKLSKMRG